MGMIDPEAAESIYCYKCGTANSSDSKHCKNCGTLLVKQEEPVQVIHSTTSSTSKDIVIGTAGAIFGPFILSLLGFLGLCVFVNLFTPTGNPRAVLLPLGIIILIVVLVVVIKNSRNKEYQQFIIPDTLAIKEHNSFQGFWTCSKCNGRIQGNSVECEHCSRKFATEQMIEELKAASKPVVQQQLAATKEFNGYQGTWHCAKCGEIVQQQDTVCKRCGATLIP